MGKGKQGNCWKANHEEEGGGVVVVGRRETQMKVGGWCRIGLEEYWV